MTSAPSTPVDQPEGRLRQFRVVADDIKIAHSVFALPFAVLGAFLAGRSIFAASEQAFWPGYYILTEFGGRLLLVLAAMVFARTVAMLANRLWDREIDARNPRTAGRALPSGRLDVGAARSVMAGCIVLFMLVCVGFGAIYGNWWPAILGPPVLAWISLYGLAKRFTAMCHIWLGSSLAISPVAAALAVDPAAIGMTPSIWLLSAMVLCWVAGFDIIYALQDVEVDREQGLHSMPGKLGDGPALWISRGLHLLAVAALVGAGFADERLALLWWIGVGLVAGLLLCEHLTVSRWGTTKIALAFFTINGVVSCVLGLLGIVDALA
jgi:4-hydroxybenzoate polyprenyltransferase